MTPQHGYFGKAKNLLNTTVQRAIRMAQKDKEFPEKNNLLTNTHWCQ
jgi:hypothetical protein